MPRLPLTPAAEPHHGSAALPSTDTLAPRAAELLAAIVESTDDAIISTDLHSIVTTWNAGAERILGFTAQDMVGSSVLRLVPDGRAHEEAYILERIQRGESVRHLETARIHRDGHPVHLSITASPIRDGHGRVIGASKIARDTTELEARERELARLSSLYAALSHINQAIARTASQDALFDRVCKVLIEHTRLRMAWIGWHDPATRRLVPVAEAGDVDGYLKRAMVYGDDRPEGRGPSGLAFREGRPYVCNDMLADPATLPWRPEILLRGYRSSAVFPIRERGTVVGTLSVYADEPGFFQDQEILLLRQAAEDMSAALDNLVRDRERREAEAAAARERQFSDTTIESMPGVLYLYDQRGQFLRWNHNIERVSGYSAREISSMHPLDLFAPESRPDVERRIAEVFERGESSLEAPLRAKDGTLTPYFFTGRRVSSPTRPA